MKSFFQFLESTAVQQATRMGLKSDGHGGWYDKKGEFVAKTEKGQLKFYNKNQASGQQDPPSTEREKNLSGVMPAGANQQPQQSAEVGQEEPAFEPNKKNKGTLTIAVGRFNRVLGLHAETKHWQHSGLIRGIAREFKTDCSLSFHVCFQRDGGVHV